MPPTVAEEFADSSGPPSRSRSDPHLIRRRRRQIAVLLLFAALYLGFPNALPDFNRYNSDDAGLYAALAESLAQGRGYTFFLPPLSIPHAVWPPVFPAVLSVVVFLFGPQLLALKLAMAVLGLIGLVCVYVYFERVRRTPYAGTIVLVTGLSPLYFAFAHNTMADLPILIPVVLSLGSIALWARAEFRLGTRVFWAAAVSVACATLLKPQAVVLVVCPVVCAWSGRGRLPAKQTAGRLAVFTLVALAPFAVWVLRGHAVEAAGYGQSSQFYADSARQSEASLHWSELLSELDGGLLGRTVASLRWTLPYALAEATWPIVNPFNLASLRWPRGSAYLLALVLLMPVLIGFLRELRDGERIATTFFVAHTVLVTMSPNWTNPRFFVVLVPFAVFYTLRGLEPVLRSNVITGVVSKGFVAAAAVALTVYLVQQHRNPFPNALWAALNDTARWSAINLPPTATVLTHNWVDFHLISGLVAFPIASPAGASESDWRAVGEGRTIFLVQPLRARLEEVELSRKFPARWDSWVTRHASEIELVFQNGYYRVYRIPFIPLDALGVTGHGASESIPGGP